jgi:transcriptional regulator of aromatic amino acid metabolism
MAFDYQGKPTLAPTAHDLMMKTQGGFAHHNDVQDVMNVKSIKEQIEKAFEATILEEDKNELAISMDSLIDMVNEAFTTIANIRSSNIERDAWSHAQILKLERYIQSVAAYIENMDEVVRSGEAHGVVVPAHTIVSQKTGETISIPAKTKSVKTNKVVLHPNDNPFDGR